MLVGNLWPQPFRGSGLDPPVPRLLSVKLHYLAVESRSCCGGGKAELCGSLGVDLPVISFQVWEPLCSLSWQPVWGDRPASGVRVKVPLSRREGASEGPGDEGHPVSQGRARSPGRFTVQATARAPCEQGCAASLAAALHAQPICPGCPPASPALAPARSLRRISLVRQAEIRGDYCGGCGGGRAGVLVVP